MRTALFGQPAASWPIAVTVRCVLHAAGVHQVVHRYQIPVSLCAVPEGFADGLELPGTSGASQRHQWSSLSPGRWDLPRCRIRRMQIVNPRFVPVAVACLCLARLVGQTTAPASTTPVEIVRDLLRSLWVYQQEGMPSTSRQIGFELPESVVNSYLVASLASRPRPMIDTMQVRLLPGNRCIVGAKINFDALQEKKPRLFSRSERKEFSGSKSVRAEFHFSLSSGFLTFEAKPLESELTPSEGLLMKIIRVIAANQPERIDATHKIPVPFGLRRLWTSGGMLCGET